MLQYLLTYRQQPDASLNAVCLYLLCYTGMIGDVNLFLNDANDPTVAEIEVIRSQMHCKHMQLVFRKETQKLHLLVSI